MLQNSVMLRVDNYGKRSRHTLVSASRNNNNRQTATVHSCVGTCRRSRFCAIMYSVAERFKQNFAHFRAVIVL